MPRSRRVAPGGVVFHVLNRGNERASLFDQASDYAAFERVMVRTNEHTPMRLLAYALMPNHWHLVLWPREDGDLAIYMHRLTVTHAVRWRLYHRSVGAGHVYQGPFKSFPVQSDTHLQTVCRYVERNPLRAGLVEKAEDWPWGSLFARRHSSSSKPPLSDWPAEPPPNWSALVNEPITDAELEAVRLSIGRGRPFGAPPWQVRTARDLGLGATLRPRGRPPRASSSESRRAPR